MANSKEIFSKNVKYLLKKNDLTTYKLIKDYNISRSLLDRLKHNKPLSTVTIDDLCKILHCSVQDIMVFIDE